MSNYTFIKSIIAVTIVGILALVGVVPQSVAQGRSEWALQHAINAQENHTTFLMSKQGVMGTGVGYNAEDEPVIKVFVKTQADVAGLPSTLDGFPVEAEVTGMFVARTDPTTRQPLPVPIGVSTGHPNITAGTIGCRVRDSLGNIYALSNNHVYADQNDASIGDAVIQPGDYDGGSSPADDIGTLYDFEPLVFSGGNNYIDAAIASSTPDQLNCSTPSDDGYGTPSSTTVTASPGLDVKKYGRTTKLTFGDVSEINVTVNVCYQCGGPFCFSCTKMAKFVDQIAITPGSFSAGGDSGSIIVTDDVSMDPVGLLFAGSSTHTIVNPINAVKDTLNLAIICDQCSSQCGNGITEGTEECDDGNTTDGDGCSAECTVELPVCGNGSLEATEECDDGNTTDGDGCSAECTVELPVCSIVGESCGNNNDCCSNKCRGKPGSKTCK